MPGFKSIARRRCDQAMKRSKEKCNTPFFKKWKCNDDCRNCICCLMTMEDGTEEHFNPTRKDK